MFGRSAGKPLETYGQYDVLAKSGNIEVRRYHPMVVAETTFTGKRGGKEQDSGFWVLAGYIGAMIAPRNVSKTTPGTAEKIPMTSPVIMTEAEGKEETVLQFVLPPNYSLETAPEPATPNVQVREMPARTLAALVFPGSWEEDHVQKRAQELQVALKAAGLEPAKSPFTSGFYNAPFVPHAMRRNEVWLELASDLTKEVVAKRLSSLT